ncbi:cell wall metabolism sensor histidine kinase WalK [Streptomyces sp. RK75]|uniref:sensor histidine kinase n=1 Tax=Streptomyces sp. RK75 TaxID=2824895 RepID=UPI001B37E157|nr:HAMP domain-containing sensor histidine kinase [Streptomyces sp. RK75]MBQ0864183.1 HAMP domain-containing histidine kinase [Streptomyces sp. RK75]
MSRLFGRLRGRLRLRRSLRARLVFSAVAMIAVVAAVIGTVTTIALHTYLYQQLDSQLKDVTFRAAGPGPPGHPRPEGLEKLRFLGVGGQPVGTVGAFTEGTEEGSFSSAARSVQQKPADGRPGVDIQPLTSAQSAALASVPRDGRPHTAELPQVGSYRVTSVHVADGTLLVGLPTASVDDTISTLVLVEVCVAGTGLLGAGIAGAASVRVALRPLRRMAHTATRVSELPLHSGEVRLRERVPVRDTDPGTEVGQVGAALNRMLGHVGSALAARHDSEQRLRRFIADASHELRTPLASIRGYAELSRRKQTDSDLDNGYALERIESEAVRMSGLVEDLLLLARLDAGRPLERRPVDVSALVVDAVSDARVAGPAHRWRLELPSSPLLVTGDEGRLRQVLVNLLANARTHTPQGTTVCAGLALRGDGDHVEVRVVDDGPGIPADDQERVFERFARGDASRSRHHGSTGLGLAIVAAVVSAHEGDVRVDSRPGRTVFTVCLPVDCAGSDTSQPPHSLATPG